MKWNGTIYIYVNKSNMKKDILSRVYRSKNAITIGGITRIGAGKNILVNAVSLTA